MHIENIQEFRWDGSWDVDFCAKCACRLQGGQSGRTKEPLAVPQGPSNGAVTFYDAGFLARAEAVGLSQVSKMLRQLTWQILAHHSFTSFLFGPRTTYCTSCLGLCKCWEWILDPFLSSPPMAFEKDPYVILPCIYYTLFFRVMSSKVMIYRIIFTPMTANIHALSPSLVNLNTRNLNVYPWHQ